jgi:hypothetical protein
MRQPSSLITEVEAGHGIAVVTTITKLVAGKRLLYRPLTGTTEALSVGIGRATKGDVTPAGERFCEILRKISYGETAAKPKPARSSPQKKRFNRASIASLAHTFVSQGQGGRNLPGYACLP